MSIKADILELQSIERELTRLTKQRRELTEQRKKVEKRIADFLESKNQSGVKFNNTSINVVEKERRRSKATKQKNQEILEILRNNHVRSPESMLEKITQAGKKSPQIERRVKMGVIKSGTSKRRSKK